MRAQRCVRAAVVVCVQFFSMNHIGIGLAGFGMIGQVHALAYREIPHYYPNTLPPIQLAAICTTRAESAERAMRAGGFDAYTTSLDELVARADVQIVDVCLPNHAHRPAILAAIRAGKHVIVDKPLALNAAEAQEIVDAARDAHVQVGMVCNYRFVPALMRAQKMIAEGALGQIYHYHMDYLHTGYQSPNRPMSWRLRRAQSGGGALMDLGAHVIDMARFLLGEFETVNTTTRTFITERPIDTKNEKRETVDVDDAAWLNAKMQNGAQGTLFVTRFATGAVDDMNVQVYGERGALKFSLQDGNVLQFFDATANASAQGWTRIPTGTQYPGALVPPPRSLLGWNRTHAENIYQFLRAVVQDKPFAPDATDGLRVHEIIDAAYRMADSR
jgi:predicted dehydrogenase